MASTATILLSLAAGILLVASSVISRSAAEKARKYVPQKFHDREAFKLALGVLGYSPPVPRPIQRRLLIGQILGSISIATASIAFLLSRHVDMAILGAGITIYVLVSLIKSFSSYLRQ
jgi:hypothetical protein